MATGPYHKWLGIPPEEQPPNHYRLLAIPKYESDVIETAAEQRTLLLRTFQTGPDAELVEPILSWPTLSQEIKQQIMLLQTPVSGSCYDITSGPRTTFTT
jgi:hypothetical protein